MGRRANRQAYFALIEACLTDLFGVPAATAAERLARFKRRRPAPSEHIEGFFVAYELAHQSQGLSAGWEVLAAESLARQRPQYNAIVGRVFGVSLSPLAAEQRPAEKAVDTSTSQQEGQRQSGRSSVATTQLSPAPQVHVRVRGR